MTQLTDEKPKAHNGKVMRRTDEHIKKNSKPKVTESGDKPHKGYFRNTTEITYPDNDPQWGHEEPL